MALPDANRPKEIVPPPNVPYQPGPVEAARIETVAPAQSIEPHPGGESEPKFEHFSGMTHLESGQAMHIREMLAAKAKDGTFTFDPATGEIMVKQDEGV